MQGNGWEMPIWLKRMMDKNHKALMAQLTRILDLIETSASTTAKAAHVLKGKTFWNGVKEDTGTMANYTGTTVEANTYTREYGNYYVDIPYAGYFDKTSKLKMPVQVKKIVEDLWSRTQDEVTAIIQSLDNYDKLTADNFIVEVQSAHVHTYKVNTQGNYDEIGFGFNFYKSYDPQTGVLTIKDGYESSVYGTGYRDFTNSNAEGKVSARVYLKLWVIL